MVRLINYTKEFIVHKQMQNTIIKENISLDWMIGYNYSYRNQPDYRIYVQDVDTATGKTSVRIQTGSTTPEVLGRFFSKMKKTTPLLLLFITINLFLKKKPYLYNYCRCIYRL